MSIYLGFSVMSFGLGLRGTDMNLNFTLLTMLCIIKSFVCGHSLGSGMLESVAG